MNKQQKTKERLSECNVVLNEGYRQKDNKIYIKEANGCYITDYDENKYIDTAMGGGSLIFGHSCEMINKRLIEQLQKGTLYTMPNFDAHYLGKMLKRVISHFDRFVFCSTGSEATMRAVRIARAYTKKRKIAIFSGGWHGSHDFLLVDDTYENEIPTKVLKSKGTLPKILDDIILLPYNDERAFKIIEKNKDDLAMVFIEPAQGSNPRDDVKEFLLKLREITQENDVLLGFDEVITGFRVALGGGQEFYDIKADIATYGKAFGGGLPIATVGGRKEVMDCICEGVFMGGTFSANPLSVVSAITTLEYLKENKDEIYISLSKKAKYLKDTINIFCEKNEIKAQIIGIGSLFRLVFTNHPIKSRYERDFYEIDMEKQTLFYSSMLDEGIHVGSNRINFLSYKHTDEEIEKIINAYIKNLKKFKELGIL